MLPASEKEVALFPGEHTAATMTATLPIRTLILELTCMQCLLHMIGEWFFREMPHFTRQFISNTT
jgi:hypothetical protein